VLAYHQACQAVDSLAQQYVALEVEFINKSLLHDADSFNWSENKEFFEVISNMLSYNINLRTFRTDFS